jgi:hypothetical protein
MMIWIKLTAVDGKQIYFNMAIVSHFQRYDDERTRLYSVVPKGDGLRSIFDKETAEEIAALLTAAKSKVLARG